MYLGFEVDRVSFVNDTDFTGYKVRLDKGGERKELTLDVNGNILD